MRLRVHFPFTAPLFLNLQKLLNNKCNQDDGRSTLSVNTGVILPFLDGWLTVHRSITIPEAACIQFASLTS